MSKIVENTMKDVCELSFQAELQKLSELDISKIEYQSLSNDKISKLAGKINFLPSEYRNILFFRYCFNSTFIEIDKVLEIKNTQNKLLYVQKMLSRIMGLENSWIDDNSIKEACKIALPENMKDYDNIEILHKINYSNAFRRKLKNIKTAQNPYMIFRLIANRVAIFILVCILSFSTILGVNADARAEFFKWIIETFPQFSIFTPQSMDDNALIELTSFKIKYIPVEFELIDTKEFKKMLVYSYSSENNQELIIKLLSSDRKGTSYYDTENVEIDEIIFKESLAYTWQTDKLTYLIWHQDGIECHISGNLSKYEIIKIAENITK